VGVEDPSDQEFGAGIDEFDAHGPGNSGLGMVECQIRDRPGVVMRVGGVGFRYMGIVFFGLIRLN
jgi:hypothetical protein